MQPQKAQTSQTSLQGSVPFVPLCGEAEFAAYVDRLSPDSEELLDLLREDHPVYDQRGSATVVRMRGWILLKLAQTKLSDAALLYVLEELDAGIDPYLVAAAAHALRAYPTPTPAFAPFVKRALNNIRFGDEPVSFAKYGDYDSASTSAVRELKLTLEWLGPCANVADDDCCTLPSGVRNVMTWVSSARQTSKPIETTVFQDHDGTSITYGEFFRGQPSIVIFFYTRCDNPLKCSLSVTKLARIQSILESEGLSGQIKTAAITYDPAYDSHERIRVYGHRRNVRLDKHNRMLRTVDGFEPLRRHFQLGLNFIESLVNRHRLEVYVFDKKGRIAGSFERLHWDEQEVVAKAVEVLNETEDEPRKKPQRAINSTLFGTLASIAVAFFPKCPFCWAAYLSVFGIASLEQIPYSPWLKPLLIGVMAINLISVWLRGRATNRMLGFYLVLSGATLILATNFSLIGVALTMLGSLIATKQHKKHKQFA
jgi:protein SCO1/2